MKSYAFSKEVNYDFYEDGCIFMHSGSKLVFCFGKHETLLLKSIVEKGVEETVKDALESYECTESADIEKDIRAFCDDVVRRGVLVCDER